MLAAGDPRIAGDVRWVNAFGAYADAGEYLAEVAAHAMTVNGTTAPWDRSGLTRQVFARLLLALVPDANDRYSLTAATQELVQSGRIPALGPALASSLTGPEA